jgi:hypothetical protein
MSNLFEVVFENVAKNDVSQLLMTLITSSKRIISAQCSEDFVLMDGDKLNTNILDLVLNFDGDISALINFQDMKVGRVILPKILLRLVKYTDQYDIDFSFDESEFENEDMMSQISEIHSYAKKLASEYDITSFFGGMEPASDEDTRYFTNELLGPLTCNT